MINAPVITIDGPSGSGKGTIAGLLAKQLGWNLLDSGALYRLTAVAARRAGVAWDDEAGVAAIAAGLDVVFGENSISLAGEDVGDAIRQEEISVGASKVAALPAVRAALLFRQRLFRQAPGLVADGRDMASVVFPDARTKVFLTASVEIRAAAIAQVQIPPTRRVCVSNTCKPTAHSAKVAPRVRRTASGEPRREFASRRRRSSEAMRNCRVPVVTCSR